MVDPYSYRQQLDAPKLILLSTNDRYWPLDALKLYWPELPSPKHVLYVPNQGHGLRDVNRVIGGLSAVHRYAATNRALPHTQWTFGSGGDALSLDVRAERPARRVLMWSARSATRDFRDARWTSRECPQKEGRYACSAARGAEGYTAVFAETSFQDEGSMPFSTTTTVCIAGPKADDAPAC